jgi:HPr kinase/phosphorylase
MTDCVLVHATSVALGPSVRAFGGREGIGVLLLGPPGSGKSDLALRLIAEGGRLVADDQTALFVRNGILHAACPGAISGLLEVRGIGILRVDAQAEAPLFLALDLDAHATIARLPEPSFFAPPDQLQAARKIPRIVLNPFETSATAKVHAAAAAAESNRFVAGVAPPNSP